MNKVKIDKYQVATFIALLFHVAGFIGLLTSKYDWFVQNIPLSFLIMFGLIVWTQPGKNGSFYLFLLVVFLAGMLAEMIGVNTTLLFGKYEFLKIPGPRIQNVPWLIGITWITLIYCCGIAIAHLQAWFFSKSPASQTLLSPQVQFVSFVADGAMLATFFDMILEPVATRFGYWTWLSDGTIPFTNYLCWFLVSLLLLTVFRLLGFPKRNPFAVHLLIIQMLFLSALRTFL